MRATLKAAKIEQFKGVKGLDVDFGMRTSIRGRNGAGKTTVATAILWALFDRDYDLNSNPEIRPLGVEDALPEVTLTMDIDGKEVAVTKRQKQRVSEKDGATRVSLTNSYAVNSVPRTERDFRKYLTELGFDFDTALSCVHPYLFASQTEKGGAKMREVLFSMASEYSDLDIAGMSDGMGDVAELLRKGYTREEIEAMHKASKRKAGDEQDSIPGQIIGLEKAKVDYDVAELELEKNSLNEQIAYAERHIASGSNAEEIDRLEQGRFELRFQINDRKREFLAGYNKEKCDLQAAYGDASDAAEKIGSEILALEMKLRMAKDSKSKKEGEKEYLADEYRKANAEQFTGTLDFDEGKWTDGPLTVCPICGQEYPADKAGEIMADWHSAKEKARDDAEKRLESERQAFLKGKKERLDGITKRGFKLKGEIEKLDVEIEETGERIRELEEEKKDAENRLEELKARMAEYENEPDIDGDPDYKSLMEEDAGLERRIRELKDNAPDVSEYERRKAELSDELESVNAKLAQAAHNIEIDGQIEELEHRKRECEQSKADAEKILYQLDLLSQKKNELLTDEINSHFSAVKWQLWEYQKNGNYKECCVPLIDGYRLGESANTGREIAAKLDICNSLQKFFGTFYPIVADGMESINGWNVPDVDTQLITMSVSDDKQLVVESEGRDVFLG